MSLYKTGGGKITKATLVSQAMPFTAPSGGIYMCISNAVSALSPSMSTPPQALFATTGTALVSNSVSSGAQSGGGLFTRYSEVMTVAKLSKGDTVTVSYSYGATAAKTLFYIYKLS